MSKIAEQKALEAYPIKEEWVGNQYGGLEDINGLSREKYQEGYDQAMQDLLKDANQYMYLSDEIGYAYACGCMKTMQDFLEKACEWLKHAEGYIITSEGGDSSIDYIFIEDFKNYMQNESEK